MRVFLFFVVMLMFALASLWTIWPVLAIKSATVVTATIVFQMAVLFVGAGMGAYAFAMYSRRETGHQPREKRSGPRAKMAATLLFLPMMVFAGVNCGTCEVLGGPGCSPGCPNETVSIKRVDPDCDEDQKSKECSEKHSH